MTFARNLSRRTMRDITPEQQKHINASCLKFKRKMEKLVNKHNSGLDSISMTFGGKTVTIAGRDHHANPRDREISQ